MKHIGAAEHREGGEKTAEGPASDGHASQVEVRLQLGGGMQRVDLVLENRTGQVEVNASFPLWVASRRSPSVGDEYGEALVRPPLGFEPGSARRNSAQGVGTAV